ncbi:MAG: NUDIX hydrolase [Acetobacteraceae bacterium]|jgi:ADP-ribose pyrophosphatase
MASDNGADIETIGTRLVYQNRWMRVREDSIRYRDGSTGIYGVVEKPDFVVIAAIDDAGRLQLVQQFRYPVGARFWELPQGAWEQQPDADPIDVARGELQEETGFTSGRMIAAGRLFQGYGYASQGYHVFLARDLTQGKPDRDPEEQDLLTRPFLLAEVEAMIRDGEIQDATTVAAFGLLRLKGLI